MIQGVFEVLTTKTNNLKRAWFDLKVLFPLKFNFQEWRDKTSITSLYFLNKKNVFVSLV